MKKIPVQLFLVMTLLSVCSCVHKSGQATLSSAQTYNTGLRGLYTVTGTEHYYDAGVDTVFTVGGNCTITLLGNAAIEVTNDCTLSVSNATDTLYYTAFDNNTHCDIYTTNSSAYQADTLCYNYQTRSAEQHIHRTGGSKGYDIRSTLTLN